MGISLKIVVLLSLTLVSVYLMMIFNLGFDMKKNVLIVVSILVGCLLILLAVQHFGPQPIWRTISDQYLNRSPLQYLHFRLSAHAFARHPENLEDMSVKTFSDSLVFKTDRDFNGGPGKGSSPLQYPPKEVYCIVAHNMDQTEFFLIALHTDGQNSDWVVHHLSMNGKMFRNLIERISCNITWW